MRRSSDSTSSTGRPHKPIVEIATGRAVQRIQRIEQGNEAPGDALEAEGFGAGEGS